MRGRVELVAPHLRPLQPLDPSVRACPCPQTPPPKETLWRSAVPGDFFATRELSPASHEGRHQSHGTVELWEGVGPVTEVQLSETSITRRAPAYWTIGSRARPQGVPRRSIFPGSASLRGIWMARETAVSCSARPSRGQPAACPPALLPLNEEEAETCLEASAWKN